MAIGAAFGGYGGYQAGKAAHAHGWGMAGYVIGGALIGAGASYLGGSIAEGGGAFSNTRALFWGSTASSTGMSYLTDGAMHPTTSLGAASYDWTTNEFGYIGKKGNSASQNIGYGLGLWTNLSDGWSAVKGGYETDKLATTVGPTGHSKTLTAGTDDFEYDFGTNETGYVSLHGAGPHQLNTLAHDAFGQGESTNSYNLTEHEDLLSSLIIQDIRGINRARLAAYKVETEGMYNYSAVTGVLGIGRLGLNCASANGWALNAAGVLNIPIGYPPLLSIEMYLREYGAQSYWLTK